MPAIGTDFSYAGLKTAVRQLVQKHLSVENAGSSTQDHIRQDIAEYCKSHDKPHISDPVVLMGGSGPPKNFLLTDSDHSCSFRPISFSSRALPLSYALYPNLFLIPILTNLL